VRQEFPSTLQLKAIYIKDNRVIQSSIRLLGSERETRKVLLGTASLDFNFEDGQLPFLMYHTFETLMFKPLKSLKNKN
jgi:hypothetical protein